MSQQQQDVNNNNIRNNGQCLEVPVVVPAVQCLPQWRFLPADDGGGGEWVSSSSSLDDLDASSTTTPATTMLDDLQPYAAILQISASTAITAQRVAEAAHLFCLSRVSMDGHAPVTCYYRLPDELLIDASAAAVCTTRLFVLDVGTTLRVVLVQESGDLWYWHVNAATLAPAKDVHGGRVQVVSLAQQFPTASSAFWLRRSAVTFLSESIILVAATPWLLAIHFVSAKTNNNNTNTATVVWSASVVLESMKARQSTLSTLVYSGMNYLAGSSSSQAIYDMAAVLTLETCHTSDGRTTVVYSWHDDGTLRQWIVPTTAAGGNNNNPMPTAVYEYPLAATEMAPLPTSSLEGARLAAAPLDATTGEWTLAVYPTTANDTTTTDGAALLPQVFLVQGRGIDLHKSYKHPTEEPMVTPRAAPSAEATLVAWQWTDPTTLQVLYQTAAGGGAAQWEQWTYSTVMNDYIVQSSNDNANDWMEPIAVQQEWCCDGVAEERALSWLNVTTTAISACSSLPDAWHAIDQAYLVYLLRPRRVRGTATVVPPSTSVICQALSELTSTNVTTTTSSSSSSSIGVQVVLAVHAWRRQEQAQKVQQRLQMSTPLAHHHHRTTAGSSRQAPSAAKTPKQLYQSLQRATTPIMSPGATTTAATAAMMIDTSILGTTQQIQHHVECWQRLLQRIWQLEAAARAVLQVQWLASSALSSSKQMDAALVVRGHAVTVVARAGRQPVVDGVQGVLDNTAIRLYACMEDHPAQAKRLAQLEDQLVQDLFQGDLVLESAECLDALEEGLGSFENNPLWDEKILSPADANALVTGFCDPNVTMEQHVQEMQRLPVGYGLAGLNLLPLDSCQETPFDRDLSADLDNVHWRLTALSLTMHCLDSYRRLNLGRYMVLKYLGVRREVSKAALWGYLQSLSFMLTCVQHVPLPNVMYHNAAAMPSLLLDPTAADDDDDKSPPKKRLSFDNCVPSWLEQNFGATGKTTALDAYLIGVTRSHILSGHAPPSMLSFPVLVSKAIFTTLYKPNTQPSLQDPAALPELLLLRSIAKDVIDHPRLALWLLSPSFAIDMGEGDDEKEQRCSAVAQCLLRLAEKGDNDAQGMVMAERAFKLMSFNPLQMQRGMERITKLHRFIGTESPFLMHLLHLVETSVRECINIYTDDIWQDENFRRVVLMYFAAALGAREWATAASAAIMMPDVSQRSEHLKRLVRHMVDNGALADLVKMCFGSQDEMSDARLQGVDLYATAMAALGSITPNVSYLNSVEGQEPSSDYQGALFALHVANNQWKRAAESMDARFVHARGALGRDVESISGEQVRARERLVVEDMALSAAARSLALSRVKDDDDAYLVSGEVGTYATLPLKLLGDTTPNRPKRGRNIGLDDNTTEQEIMDRLDRFMRDVDIDLAATRSLCLQMLHIAGKVSNTEAKEFLKEPVSRTTDQLLVSKLFKCGYYHYGLMMGKALRSVHKGNYGGLDILHDIASHLTCNFLIPLMLGKEESLKDQSFPKPSVGQMQASLDALSREESPRLTPLAKSLKVKDSSSSCARQLAGEILRHVTITYTTAATPLAHEVVECLLKIHGPAVLPEWLHHLMVHGTTPSDSPPSPPGLFAKRSDGTNTFFLGDPSSLLTKYTYAGMFEEACRVVVETLDVHNRGSAAAHRLPEKGNMDFVPYDKIDLLYNLIDTYIEKGIYSGDQAARIKKSQKEMEDNLDRHFELLEISEMGLKSARALGV